LTPQVVITELEVNPFSAMYRDDVVTDDVVIERSAQSSAPLAGCITSFTTNLDVGPMRGYYGTTWFQN
jgi:hypothetical protein